MRIMQKLWIILFIATAAPVLIAVTNCAENMIAWNGSVDAAFKYNSKKKSTVVYKVRPKTMSEESGLKTNDIVLAVDGTDVSNLSLEEVTVALRGPVGTMAKLTVKRGEQILEIKIERRPINATNQGETNKNNNYDKKNNKKKNK